MSMSTDVGFGVSSQALDLVPAQRAAIGNSQSLVIRGRAGGDFQVLTP